MNREFLVDLCKKTNMPQVAAEKAFAILDSSHNKVRTLAKEIIEEKNARNLEEIIKEDRCKGSALALATMLYLTEYAYEQYNQRGIPLDIYYATMGDIALWTSIARREFGVDGVCEVGWTKRSVLLELIQLGRLQFELDCTFNFPEKHFLTKEELENFPLKENDIVLSVHIPEAGPLDYEESKKSFDMAREFFPEYFPEYDFKAFTCNSWLLYPDNHEFMKADSRILKFETLFNVISSKETYGDFVRRLWYGNVEKIDDIKDFAEDTSLQRAVKHRLLNGEAIGSGYGYILR